MTEDSQDLKWGGEKTMENNWFSKCSATTENSSAVSTIVEDSVTTSTIVEYHSNFNFSSFLHKFKVFFYLQFDLSGQRHCYFLSFHRSHIIVHKAVQSFRISLWWFAETIPKNFTLLSFFIICFHQKFSFLFFQTHNFIPFTYHSQK